MDTLVIKDRLTREKHNKCTDIHMYKILNAKYETQRTRWLKFKYLLHRGKGNKGR
jgi:hypothetical protein